ncbi:hypothetical protein CQW23_18670 [Capsicum baccatum]|uniref:AT-hook motif nuclear-localized protein n=1 Tax=Capsicum baccatum TaxID=33114 RepID=A0A2G2W3L2_CAPBA|nr:hypothetical protein CQW23_18670 [Capsicum baccatum]
MDLLLLLLEILLNLLKKKRGRPRKSVVTKFVVDGNTGVAEPSQKKRGRPRKSVVDGICVTSATSSKNPSKKKQQQPEASETVGSPVAAVGANAELPKKKRGLPRKIVADGNTCVTGATCSGNPSKKVYGRTSGSKKKQQEPKVLGSAELGSTMRTIHVNT